MPDEQPIDDDSNNANNDKMRRYPSSHIRREVLQTITNPKYQVLAKYSFWRGGVYSRPTQIPCTKSWPNFYFWWRWYCGHHIPQILEWRHSRNFAPEILVTGMWWCIADSLSHTTCLETNQQSGQQQRSKLIGSARCCVGSNALAN